MFTNPQITDFKAQFFRDFPFGGSTGDPANFVLDQDIANGFAYASLNINPALWPTQSAYNLGYLLLSAHRMVLNIRASSQGLNGQYNWAQTQKGVGQVSESFQIPQRIIDNPELMMLTKTNYGAQYLEMLLPLLAGQMFTVCGRTKP